MASHVYTNASEKYSQNADSKLGSNTMVFESGKICINLADFFYYFITIQWALDSTRKVRNILVLSNDTCQLNFAHIFLFL